MSKYSKLQEYRLQEHLRQIEGVEILAYYGSRNTKAGDVLIRYKDKKFRFDHKSTTSPDFIRLQYDWLFKLATENMSRVDEDGWAISAITFSLYRKHQIYVFTSCWLDKVEYTYENGAATRGLVSHVLSNRVSRKTLEECVSSGRGLCIDHEKYIYTLEEFLTGMIESKPGQYQSYR